MSGLKKATPLAEHMPGKHNQASHGKGGGRAPEGKPSKSARATGARGRGTSAASKKRWIPSLEQRRKASAAISSTQKQLKKDAKTPTSKSVMSSIGKLIGSKPDKWGKDNYSVGTSGNQLAKISKHLEGQGFQRGLWKPTSAVYSKGNRKVKVLYGKLTDVTAVTDVSSK